MCLRSAKKLTAFLPQPLLGCGEWVMAQELGHSQGDTELLPWGRWRHLGVAGPRPANPPQMALLVPHDGGQRLLNYQHFSTRSGITTVESA